MFLYKTSQFTSFVPNRWTSLWYVARGNSRRFNSRLKFKDWNWKYIKVEAWLSNTSKAIRNGLYAVMIPTFCLHQMQSMQSMQSYRRPIWSQTDDQKWLNWFNQSPARTPWRSPGSYVVALSFLWPCPTENLRKMDKNHQKSTVPVHPLQKCFLSLHLVVWWILNRMSGSIFILMDGTGTESDCHHSSQIAV